MTARARNLLVSTMTVMAAMLIVMAFAYSASAAAPYTYTGKVIAIDNANKILTVQAGPHDQRFFRLNDNATVSKCNMSDSWSNIKVGDEVTINYFEKSYGDFLANDISLLPMSGQRC